MHNKKNKRYIFLIAALLFYLPLNASGKSQKSFSSQTTNNTTQAKIYGPTAQAAKAAHDAYSLNDYKTAGEYYEKAYRSSKNKVLLENATVSYLTHAINLGNEKKYDEAIKYSQKALSLSPENKNAKEVLSDIYYSKGYESYYGGNPQAAKADLENAMKYSYSSEQSKRINEAKVRIEAYNQTLKDKKDSNKGVSIVSANNVEPGTQNSKYKAYAPDSMTELVKLLEFKVYGQSNDAKPILQRIQTLEKDVYNASYENENLNLRVERLKYNLLPELESRNLQTSQGSANLDYGKNNYIREIIDQSGGRARIFGEMPIRIYIESDGSKAYKRHFSDIVLQALKEWETASEDRIKFKIVNDPLQANIKILWCDYFEDFDWQPKLVKEDISEEKKMAKYGKASSIIRIGSIAAMAAGALTGVPIVGMAGSLGGSVASPILQYKSLGLYDKALTANINTEITIGMTKEQADIKIRQIALHQIGHAIGIYGHSPNPEDIMHATYVAQSISERDKNTIKEIYRSLTPSKP